MVGYIIASILAIVLGQVAGHLINRLPEIIDENETPSLVIATLKKGFKIDYICSIVNLVLFNLLVYFIGGGILSYIYMVAISLLVVVFAIDYKLQLIPDTVQVLLGIVGVINVIYVGITSGLREALFCIVGAIIGGAIFYALGFLGKIIFKKDGMGMGDVKLMAALGLLFGIKGILTVTLVSFFVSAIISIILIICSSKKLDSYIPFGPFIAIGVYGVMLLGMDTYINMFLSMCEGLGNWLFNIV